jgi:hypothetical protein
LPFLPFCRYRFFSIFLLSRFVVVAIF